jgi:hypothetical protein
MTVEAASIALFGCGYGAGAEERRFVPARELEGLPLMCIPLGRSHERLETMCACFSSWFW